MNTVLSRLCTSRTHSLQPHPPTSPPSRLRCKLFARVTLLARAKVVTMFGKKKSCVKVRAPHFTLTISHLARPPATTVGHRPISPHTRVALSIVAHIRTNCSHHDHHCGIGFDEKPLSTPILSRHLASHAHTHTHSHM